jgi:hypothetical protein
VVAVVAGVVVADGAVGVAPVSSLHAAATSNIDTEPATTRRLSVGRG